MDKKKSTYLIVLVMAIVLIGLFTVYQYMNSEDSNEIYVEIGFDQAIEILSEEWDASDLAQLSSSNSIIYIDLGNQLLTTASSTASPPQCDPAVRVKVIGYIYGGAAGNKATMSAVCASGPGPGADITVTDPGGGAKGKDSATDIPGNGDGVCTRVVDAANVLPKSKTTYACIF